MTFKNKKRAIPRTPSHKAKKCVDRTLAFAKRFLEVSLRALQHLVASNGGVRDSTTVSSIVDGIILSRRVIHNEFAPVCPCGERLPSGHSFVPPCA